MSLLLFSIFGYLLSNAVIYMNALVFMHYVNMQCIREYRRELCITSTDTVNHECTLRYTITFLQSAPLPYPDYSTMGYLAALALIKADGSQMSVWKSHFGPKNITGCTLYQNNIFGQVRVFTLFILHTNLTEFWNHMQGQVLISQLIKSN